MKEDNELVFEYDEDDAVAFIQNYLPQEIKGKFSDDELNYIIDLIYEFYEDKGYLNLNEEDDDVDVEIDEDELIAFVVKQAQKDKMGKFDAEDITFIVQGELAYCDSLDIFE
ncbi:MAG: hypothetical protein FWD60_04865 [Candidatus Azobacteroides sp.]|nr:hypothetical protein [Candidatus Azobacteroides sp.]